MIADEDWLPASGCLPCPFEISLPESWGTMNPLPGITKPGGGYYSVPLKTWYLPIQSCILYGCFAVGEINDADYELFMAIALHEFAGHGIGKGFFFESPRKQLLRMCATQACTHLQKVMENSQYEELWDVCELNDTIAAIIRSIALVEELCATLFGMESLREINLIPSHIVNRIEDQFVANHSNPKNFGRKFRNLYARLSKLYHKFGDKPLGIIADFAAGYVATEKTGANVNIFYGKEHFTEAESEKRFRQAIRFLEQLEYSAMEWRKLTLIDWALFFDRNLPGFREFFDEYLTVIEKFKATYESVSTLSANFDWNPLEPFIRPNRVFIYLAGPPWSPDVQIPSDLMSKIRYTWKDNTPPLPITIPEDLMLLCDSTFPEVLNDGIWTNVYQKFSYAGANNRTLVFMYTRNLESSVPGFCLVPAAEGDTDALIPELRCTAEWDLSSIEGHARFDEWKRRASAAIPRVHTLYFYECLRQQVAARCGLRCPKRQAPDKPCCGESRLLLQLFEAGQKAAAKGWRYTKWEMPQECQGSQAV